MAKLGVLIIGFALISFLIWWFFGKHERSEQTALMRGDYQEIRVEVNGGYNPQTIVLQKGIPASLIFHRKDPSSCLDQVVFSDFGVQKPLPLNKDTLIDLTPKEKGEFDFACGMNMYRGKLIVK